ncbi:Uncharacterized protein Fot_35633 [Forsythia ovata]|uniref:Uncharacterized protein n=1 Tax=Forsythia ovata TaxID=205694 RepID=A0ABD1SM35_9LAMI
MGAINEYSISDLNTPVDGGYDYERTSILKEKCQKFAEKKVLKKDITQYSVNYSRELRGLEGLLYIKDCSIHSFCYAILLRGMYNSSMPEYTSVFMGLVKLKIVEIKPIISS